MTRPAKRKIRALFYRNPADQHVYWRAHYYGKQVVVLAGYRYGPLVLGRALLGMPLSPGHCGGLRHLDPEAPHAKD